MRFPFHHLVAHTPFFSECAVRHYFNFCMQTRLFITSSHISEWIINPSDMRQSFLSPQGGLHFGGSGGEAGRPDRVPETAQHSIEQEAAQPHRPALTPPFCEAGTALLKHSKVSTQKKTLLSLSFFFNQLNLVEALGDGLKSKEIPFPHMHVCVRAHTRGFILS